MFRSTAMIGQVEGNLTKKVLSDLESDDPAKITALKEQLHTYIEQGRKWSESWNLAAEN
jgi:hypothetical protein